MGVEEAAWGVFLQVAVRFKEKVASFVPAIALNFHLVGAIVRCPNQIKVDLWVSWLQFNIPNADGFGIAPQLSFDIHRGLSGYGYTLIYVIHNG